MADIYTRYFAFSQKQMEVRRKIETKPKFGTVIVNGSPKVYTDIMTSANQNDKQYPDTIVLISGDIRKIKFTEPSD